METAIKILLTITILVFSTAVPVAFIWGEEAGGIIAAWSLLPGGIATVLMVWDM